MLDSLKGNVIWSILTPQDKSMGFHFAEVEQLEAIRKSLTSISCARVTYPPGIGRERIRQRGEWGQALVLAGFRFLYDETTGCTTNPSVYPAPFTVSLLWSGKGLCTALPISRGQRIDWCYGRRGQGDKWHYNKKEVTDSSLSTE